MENNIKYFKDFLNEEVYIASKRKLRDAIHDIVVNDLDYGEEMKIDDLSKKLNDKFNIIISEDILKKLIFDEWWKRDDNSLIRDKDKKWIDVWPYKKTIERVKPKKEPPLGKSRKKIEKEEKQKTYNNYGYGGGYGNHRKSWKDRYPYY